MTSHGRQGQGITVETDIRTVLYIEDDPVNQKLMTRLLEKQLGVRVVNATDGDTGLGLALSAPPSVILLDLGLPGGISGREVLSGLRAADPTAATPIVILSGEPARELEGPLLKAGATAYVQKPFNILDVMNLVKELLDPPQS